MLSGTNGAKYHLFVSKILFILSGTTAESLPKLEAKKSG